MTPSPLSTWHGSTCQHSQGNAATNAGPQGSHGETCRKLQVSLGGSAAGWPGVAWVTIIQRALPGNTSQMQGRGGHGQPSTLHLCTLLSPRGMATTCREPWLWLHFQCLHSTHVSLCTRSILGSHGGGGVSEMWFPGCPHGGRRSLQTQPCQVKHTS